MESNTQRTSGSGRQAFMFAGIVVAAAITLITVRDVRADRPKQVAQQGSIASRQATPPKAQVTSINTRVSAQQATGKVWSNPETRERYLRYRQEEAKAYQNAAKAWDDYGKKLGQAENDVRTVRNEAIKGAVRGSVAGPGGAAAGAAWGGAKGAARVIYDRGKDYYKNNKQAASRQSAR